MRDLNKFGKVLFQIINLIVLLTSGTNYDEGLCYSGLLCRYDLLVFRCALNFVFHLFGNMNMS